MASGVREAERGPAGQRGEGGGRLWAAEGQALSVPHGGELELQLLLGVEGPLRAYLLKGETGEQGGAPSPQTPSWHLKFEACDYSNGCQKLH